MNQKINTATVFKLKDFVVLESTTPQTVTFRLVIITKATEGHLLLTLLYDAHLLTY